jgi:hypothetical protein
MAAYWNVAANDPISRLGLQSFDDTEVKGSALPCEVETRTRVVEVHVARVPYARVHARLPRVLDMVVFIFPMVVHACITCFSCEHLPSCLMCAWR